MNDRPTDPNNAWRLETPGNRGWTRTATPDDPNKFFMVSTDGHVQEPADLWHKRIDREYRERLPGVVVGSDGKKYQKTEGFRPLRIRNIEFKGEDALRNRSGATPTERIRDLARDGVDAEILFPNKGLAMWATQDPYFSQAMCRVWNDWAWETFSAFNDQLCPMACIASQDIEGSIQEIERCANLGFRGLALPCKPVWGAPNHLSCIDGSGPTYVKRQRRSRNQLRSSLPRPDYGTHRQSVRIGGAGSISRPYFWKCGSWHRVGSLGALGDG